ncbi:hypothetical protein TD95_000465 [Thielaviopsis punctulata]|uniref:Uncharacterized protein n=1 Tax=Thielaviopsis punctulata TaxID=72032 RepID=A0A0F4ZBZ0_9PEZI|nr:hypothetical protein TD95_000465 [Thielaviopsis punctulata]
MVVAPSSAVAAPLKPATKRLAFNDHNNTTRGALKTLDTNIGKPGTAAAGSKSLIFNPVSLKKADDMTSVEAFLRPAHRRIRKVVSLAQFDSNTVAEAHSVHIHEPMRLFDDYTPLSAEYLSTDTSTDLSESGSRPSSSDDFTPISYEDALSTFSNDASSGRKLRHHSSHPSLGNPELPALRRVKSRDFREEELSLDLPPMDDLIEALYEDAVEYHSDVEEDKFEPAKSSHLPPKPTQEPIYEAIYEANTQGVLDAMTAAVPDMDTLRDEKLLVNAAATSSTEDFWDEEDEDLYLEQGYQVSANGQCPYPKTSRRLAKDLELAAQWVQRCGQFDFSDECWDTSMAAEYADDIFEHYHRQDRLLQPRRDYMDTQPEIQWSMRAVLVDWIVQAHMRFNLLPETLFLAVNCVDRFLAQKVVTLPKLQLVGATALFIAAKYEEINCPSLSEMVYMVENSYTEDEIRKAERFMLLMLNFELGSPGPMSFLRRISKADNYDIDTRTMAKYFLEVALVDERFVGLPQSYLSAAAHCLSRMLLQLGNWSPAHVHFSGYTYQQLRPAMEILLKCCLRPKVHHSAVYEKYSQQKYSHSAIYAAEDIALGFRLPLFHPSVAEMIASLESSAVVEERVMVERE